LSGGFERGYQFKITLKGSRPPIWRRIQVPESYTFWDLHIAIQDAMGWEHCHLHEFEVVDPSTGFKVYIGIPSEGAMDVLAGWEERIADYFSMENRKAEYIYDFGDEWVHRVLLEKILPREENTGYPKCIGGKRACPPEDCGGVWGYYELLRAWRDPNSSEHSEAKEWLD